MLVRHACLSAAAALMGFAVAGSSARAAGPLNFDFSFNASTYGNTGVVTGEIIGLTDNSTGPASDVIVTSGPALDGFTYPFDPETAINYNEPANTFTLSNGVITAENLQFGSNGPQSTIELKGSGHYDELQGSGGYSEFYSATAGAAFNAITFTPVAVPEPASLSLLGLGATALLGRRRLRSI